MTRILILVGLVIVASGCGNEDPTGEEGLCVVSLVWNDVTYDRVRVADPPRLGRSLGEARLECEDGGEGETVEIAAIEGADPATTIALLAPNMYAPDQVTVWAPRESESD
jgi:hypothetical protein